MPLDSEFETVAAELLDYSAGTESVAPLLYTLGRLIKPRVILEVGAGYTSIFLLEMLRDNISEFTRHSTLCAAKTLKFRAGLSAEIASPQADVAEKVGQLRHDWATSEPALANPFYYDTAFAPNFYSVDLSDEQHRKCVTRRVEFLKMEHVYHELHGDFVSFASQFKENKTCFDLVWFDCGGHREYSDFFVHYWPLVNARGGTVVLHNTITNPFLNTLIKEWKLRQAANPLGLEVMSFSEPNKYDQNGATIIRKTDELLDDFSLNHQISCYLHENKG